LICVEIPPDDKSCGGVSPLSKTRRWLVLQVETKADPLVLIRQMQDCRPSLNLRISLLPRTTEPSEQPSLPLSMLRGFRQPLTEFLAPLHEVGPHLLVLVLVFRHGFIPLLLGFTPEERHRGIALNLLEFRLPEDRTHLLKLCPVGFEVHPQQVEVGIVLVTLGRYLGDSLFRLSGGFPRLPPESFQRDRLLLEADSLLVYVSLERI
jgi:hypothetical protein